MTVLLVAELPSDCSELLSSSNAAQMQQSTSKMRKLLITGASGFLGWYLCQAAQSQWQVYGSYGKHAYAIPSVTMLAVDLTDFASIQHLIRTVQPDALIHAAALSSPNACQLEPDRSYQINVTASAQLAELSAAAHIPFVFISSEQVFDGLNPPYREADPVRPVNLYGKHKAAAEAQVLERHSEVVICRMPLLFGCAPTADSFIQPWVKTLQQGETVKLFTDEIRNPVSGGDAANGILLALEKAKGIIHLGGRERLSRHQIGCLLAEALNLPTEQLVACQQADVRMAAPRPPDASLDSALAFSLGYQPKTVKAALAELKSQL
jgi:dTDP-4-dehydrorhamnose reductase